MEPESYAVKPIHPRPAPYRKPDHGPNRARRLDAESRRRATERIKRPTAGSPVIADNGGGWFDGWAEYVVIDGAVDLIGGVASSVFDNAGDVCGTIGEGVGEAIGGLFDGF